MWVSVQSFVFTPRKLQTIFLFELCFYFSPWGLFYHSKREKGTDRQRLREREANSFTIVLLEKTLDKTSTTDCDMQLHGQRRTTSLSASALK